MRTKRKIQQFYEAFSCPLKTCWTFPDLSKEIECVYYENGIQNKCVALELARYISDTSGYQVSVNDMQDLMRKRSDGSFPKEVEITQGMMLAFTDEHSLVVCGCELQEKLDMLAQKLGKIIKIVCPEFLSVSLLYMENMSLYISGMEIERRIKPVSVVAVLASDSNSWISAIELCHCVNETYCDLDVMILFVPDADDVRYNAYASRCFLSIAEKEIDNERVSVRIASSVEMLKDFCGKEHMLVVLPRQKFYLTKELEGALFYVSDADFSDLWGFGYGYGRKLLLDDMDKLVQYAAQNNESDYRFWLWQAQKPKHYKVAAWLRELYWLRRRLSIFRLKMV